MEYIQLLLNHSHFIFNQLELLNIVNGIILGEKKCWEDFQLSLKKGHKFRKRFFIFLVTGT